MHLSFDHRRVGDAIVVTCTGRLIAGEETAALQKLLDELASRTRYVVLHLGAVDFMDSGGLGLLVRNLSHARRASGSLSVCAMSAKIDEVLRVTKLKKVFEPYETEADAIADVHVRMSAGAAKPDITVLCVDGSPDVGAYLRELLKLSGYRTITAQNLPDALTLLIATKPKVVVVSAELSQTRGTRTAEAFHRMSAERAVVQLPPAFSGHEAGDAADQVLGAIRAALAP